LQSHFEPDRIFFSKETLTRITPHTWANKRLLLEKMKTMIESMVKGMLRMKVQQLREG
jgi:hypothetical protein